MSLDEIAAGIEVTTEQRDQGVATVDDTGDDPVEALEPFAEELPCSAAAAATVVETYAGGTSVGAAGEAAGVSAMTAAKTLFLVGVEGVHPLTPDRRAVVRDWLAGDLSRTDALMLSDATETEFALATYIETHEPLPNAAAAVEGVLEAGRDAAVEKRDRLAGTMSGVDDLL